MVLRSSDAARDLPGRTTENAAQLDELARAQSRGAQALRNDAGHILELNPASPNPLVTPQGTDSALRFQDGMLTVTDGDGENTRDMTVRSMRTEQLLITNNAIKCIPYDGALRFSSFDGAFEVANRDGTELRGIRTSRVESAGEVRAATGIRAEAGLSCGQDFIVEGRARATNWSSSIYDGAIRHNPNGAVECVNYAGNEYRGIYATNFAPPPSWRALKVDRRPAAEFLGGTYSEIVDRLDLSSSWTYDPQVQSFDDGAIERIGLKLDELPEPLIVRRTDGDTGDDRSSYDLAAMLNVALGAIQEQGRRIAALERRLVAADVS